MKIQCDVCDKEEASVFCSADEAALCEACDRRVHHANKLASKHLRFSLLHPPLKDSPLCDVCQEKRALLFCQQDRALLCKECDFPIHQANEHTRRHNRFLLTGVKLSAPSSAHQTSSSSSTVSNAGSKRISKKTESKNASTINDPLNFRTNSTARTSESTSNYFNAEIESSYSTNQEGSVSTSSIAEYLMETLPGWHVEDFLDPSCSPHPNGFCKTHEQIMPPFIQEDFESSLGYFSPATHSAFWVPQTPMVFPTKGINGRNGYEEFKNVMNPGTEWNADDFRVPRISSPQKPSEIL